MNLAKIAIAGIAAVTLLNSVALAQQTAKGTITRIDRVNGTVTIQQTPVGTVGAAGTGATEQYKVQDRALLDTVHAGDRVTFTSTGTGSAQTVTRFER